MKKTLKVINSCQTLNQMYSAWNYVLLAYASDSNWHDLLECYNVFTAKLRTMTGARVRDLLDYRAYAQHLLQLGQIKDAEEFLQFANYELDKLEMFYGK
jgi:hypothetical protein